MMSKVHVNGTKKNSHGQGHTVYAVFLLYLPSVLGTGTMFLAVPLVEDKWQIWSQDVLWKKSWQGATSSSHKDIQHQDKVWLCSPSRCLSFTNRENEAQV